MASHATALCVILCTMHHNLFAWFFPFEHFTYGHSIVGFLAAFAWLALGVSVFVGFQKKFRTPITDYRLLVPAVAASFLVFTTVANAMCPVGFVPPGRVYHPDNNTRGLLVWDGITEKLIIEPSFTGNAKDFGLMMPTPSRPEINEAPEKIFEELEDLTNPIVQRQFFEGPDAAVLSAPAPGVVVVEQKDVGDYTASVLTATSADALLNWLKDNGYVYSANDKANIDYYVAKPGFHFVALKVNMSKAKVDASGMLSGRLRPIEFSFASAEPMLPLRSMAGDMDAMDFTVYTLADTPYYIPGADVLYSKELASEDTAKVPSLERYKPQGQWLVRNNVRFDPKQIREDLALSKANEKLSIPNVSLRRRINPQFTPRASGVVEKREIAVAYVPVNAGDSLVPFPANLGRGSRGEQVKLLQIILRDIGGVYPEGFVTGYYGPLTERAVKRFQELYRHQILAPLGLAAGTGYFGSRTRLVVNQLASLSR